MYRSSRTNVDDETALLAGGLGVRLDAMDHPDQPIYDVVWPKSPLGVQARRAAPRLDTLAGKRIAFLWDHVFRGDELFPVLGQELTARHDNVEIIPHEAFGNTHGSDEKQRMAELPEFLARRQVDAVVSGMGC